ncbi:cyclopropane-fatty-acyl-phospholipid synthase [Spirochaetota bacterium]|nr:cyclopropane-fatty-acyl-phospholipid synthase [Spirochaetota bacterium]
MKYWFSDWLIYGLSYLPNRLIGWAIRRALRNRLEFEWQRRRAHPEWDREFIQMMDEGPIAPHADVANAQHYEVPSAFYQHVLGPRLKYSSALWKSEQAEIFDAKALISELAEAEEDMLRLVCERSLLAADMHILDLGCGWGSFSLYVLEHYPTITVTALSNSRSQKVFIEERARNAGFSDRLKVVTADIGAFQTEERFDKIISIEMFEHMRNHRKLLAKIAMWLKDDRAARLFIHVFVHRSYNYLFDEADRRSWMSRYFFTHGMMPRLRSFEVFSDVMEIEESWVINGRHYAKTAAAWLARHERYKHEILKEFKAQQLVDPSSRDVMRRDINMRPPKVQWWYWKVFFMACRELFAYREGMEWFVAHYRLRKPT